MRTTPRGAVEVDDHLRTSQPHIFALGDVNGGPQFTYVSLDDARIVVDQLLGEGRRSRSDRVAVPRTLFITPPLATAGLTEREARAQGRNIVVSRERVADIVAMPRAYTVEETRGVMKCAGTRRLSEPRLNRTGRASCDAATPGRLRWTRPGCIRSPGSRRSSRA